MVSIYFAAPLHNKEDQDKNAEQVALLRKNGYTVYSPYEHGVWEDLVEKLGGEKQCREYLYKQDIYAIGEYVQSWQKMTLSPQSFVIVEV